MKDYLIVGFGISGLSLSSYLSRLGKDYLVISDATQQASRAAGGLLNPVMLKTGKLIWNIESFLPFAKDFYNSFGENRMTSYPIHRVFNSIEEQNNHLVLANHQNKAFVSTQLHSGYLHVNAPYKMSKVEGGGIVDILALLAFQQKKLVAQKQFIKASFHFDQLEIQQDYFRYQSIKARHVIFAEGFGVAINPFFKHLPIQGNKGEYLIINSPSLQLEAILKNKFFLIPLQGDLYKYGATYQRGVYTNEPSIQAKSELEHHLRKLIDCPYTISGQVAGIRPTVKDKKPIYGTHSSYSNIHILNGMGSRGLLMAPLLAKELIDHIEAGLPLRREVNVNRFDV